MKRSWLVQRLDPPAAGFFAQLGKDNPFAFGGGLKNGGLADKAMDLLRGIFSFDYMGAAEFEFGAVPEALDGLAKAKKLAAFDFTFPLAKVAKPWTARKKAAAPSGDATVYVICRPGDESEVTARIKGWAGGGYGDGLKEGTRLAAVLRPADDYTPRTCGWLELDNGFFFFTDRTMWEQTAALFSVKVPVSQ